MARPTFVRAMSRLGAEVERRWRAASFAPKAFTSLAAAALARGRLASQFDMASLVAWTLESPAMPAGHLPFEEPEDAPVLTLRASDRVAVDLHLYAPSLTSIHDHDFDGAVLILEGACLHTSFAIDDARAAARHVRTGDLRIDRVTHLGPGAIEAVHAGARTIHRVAHLADRTAMLVVRSMTTLGARAQHRYFEAGLAVRTFAKAEPGRPQGFDVRAKTLAFLTLTDPDAARAYRLRALATSDAWSTVALLLGNWDALAESGDLRRVVKACALRLGPWVHRLANLQRREADLARPRWSSLRTEASRLRTALRLTLGDRAADAWLAARIAL